MRNNTKGNPDTAALTAGARGLSNFLRVLTSVFIFYPFALSFHSLVAEILEGIEVKKMQITTKLWIQALTEQSLLLGIS
jgi:hypothetical protein